eukprot:s664_g22.t1
MQPEKRHVAVWSLFDTRFPKRCVRKQKKNFSFLSDPRESCCSYRMGAASCVLELVSLTLRCGVTLIVACLAAACGCALVAETNSLLYGLEVHKTYSDLVACVPSEALSLAIVVLPSICCWFCLQGDSPVPEPDAVSRSRSLCRCLRSWQNSCTAALIAGLLLGVLAGPPAGPYMAHVKDADVREETDGIHVRKRAVHDGDSDL